MTYIFGPVPSRRLGLSLGVDLIPPKTCTYDCLYCQIGKTTDKTVDVKPYFRVTDVLNELEKKLDKARPDTITLAGSGEPTLHSDIDQVISFIKERSKNSIALLTNGSLLFREEVRKRILGADIIMPTLSTVFEKTFRAIHRPHSSLDLRKIIEGIKTLRMEYKGRLFLEVVLLGGYNDSDDELEGIKGVMEKISPDKIQLNTVVRPPSDPRARPIDRDRLETIKSYFGEKAEVIAQAPFKKIGGNYDSNFAAVVEMARRRPVRLKDISGVLEISPEETEGLLKGMLLKGYIKKQDHEGESFYIAGSNDILNDFI